MHLSYKQKISKHVHLCYAFLQNIIQNNTSEDLKMSKFRIPKTNSVPYDADKQIAVIKCSICTGEQVAGFKSKEDGHFTEVMLIRDAKDLEMFKKMYKVTEVKKEY